MIATRSDVGPADDEAARVTLSAEQVDVATARRVTAQVFVDTRTTDRVERVEIDLQSERYDVERIAIGRPVTEAPATRQEGDVTIIPVLTEEVVVHRQLILKEEIRIRRVASVQRHSEDVVLRSQHAEVRRVPTEHQASTGSEPEQTQLEKIDGE